MDIQETITPESVAALQSELAQLRAQSAAQQQHIAQLSNDFDDRVRTKAAEEAQRLFEQNEAQRAEIEKDRALRASPKVMKRVTTWQQWASLTTAEKSKQLAGC